MKSFWVLLPFVACAPALADELFPFPVSIPQECIAVAQREHVATTVKSKGEAMSAKHKLDRLSDRDPDVHLCKQSVTRLMASMASN